MLKLIARIIAVVIIVVAVLFLVRRCQGDGDGPGAGEPAVTTKSPAIEQQTSEPNLPQVPKITPANTTEDGKEAENSNIISIRIEENHVYVNGEEISDAEALKSYIEEINDDEKIFELTEDEKQSILATHNWVHGVFDELEIPLIPAID